ncbi:MAG: tetratricopeptide repeat protein [Gammaproteobacteria bacterium]|nr:tetratricopeptide repeat protein [Gammaproteobacteria bacterium]
MSDGFAAEPMMARAALDRAEALIDLGRVEQALPLLAQAVAMDPDDAETRCRLAQAYTLLDRHEEAIEHAQAALHRDPDSEHAHFRLAISLMGLKAFDQALEHARAATRLEPDDSANLHMLARAEYYTGHYKQAIDAAQRAIELEPDNAKLHELLGDLAFNIQRRPAKAIPHYREALRHAPDDADIHASLGRALAETKQPFEAAESLLRALRIDPANPSIRQQLFALLHHDLMSAPADVRRQLTEEFGPTLTNFYEDTVGRTGWQGRLRMGSLALMWLIAILLLAMLFTPATGDPIAPLMNVLWLALVVWLALSLVHRIGCRWRLRRWTRGPGS